MPSPFPGMDPFLESQGFWQDFHFRVIACCSDLLSSSLPGNYAALIEERISLVDLTGEARLGFRPDVSIVREERGTAAPREQGSVATLEPVAVPMARKDLDEVPERWIEIKRLPDLALVTVIEILSPTNKSGLGRSQYLQKRREVLDQPVHLVEIDLLLRGPRLPMGGPLPRGDYYAFVSRTEKRESSDVYAWSIRRALPAIPIPLSPPDPDLSLDLATVVARAYDRGRYQRLIHYAEPLDLPLTGEDQNWLRTLVPASS
jgi:Protein of unknown function (DUF4058)